MYCTHFLPLLAIGAVCVASVVALVSQSAVKTPIEIGSKNGKISLYAGFFSTAKDDCTFACGRALKSPRTSQIALITCVCFITSDALSKVVAVAATTWEV